MLQHKIFNHRNIYLFGLALLAISLPTSMFGMSVSLFLLVFNWLFEGKFRYKRDRLKTNREVLLFCGLYVIHLIWLLASKNLAYGLHDLRIKLPLLVLPLVLGSSEPLSKKQFERVIDLFGLAVVFASLVSMMVLLGFGKREIMGAVGDQF